MFDDVEVRIVSLGRKSDHLSRSVVDAPGALPPDREDPGTTNHIPFRARDIELENSWTMLVSDESIGWREEPDRILLGFTQGQK